MDEGAERKHCQHESVSYQESASVRARGSRDTLHLHNGAFYTAQPNANAEDVLAGMGGGALRPCTGGSRTLNAAAEAFKKGDVTASGPVTDDATYLIPGDIGQ